jgi:hypothetical protein
MSRKSAGAVGGAKGRGGKREVRVRARGMVRTTGEEARGGGMKD